MQLLMPPPTLLGGIGGNDSYTKILLHCDGSDGSTTITDSNAGGSAHTWTAGNSAQIDTAQSKLGGSSLLLSTATSDFATTPDHSDLDFGSGEYSIDCWVRLASLPTGTLSSGNGTVILSQWANLSRGWIFGIGTTGGGNYQLSASYNSTGVVGSNISLSTNTWYHVAMVRDNTGTDTIRFFLNGVAAGTDTSIDGVTITNSTAAVYIGRAADSFSASLNGWVDELRVSKGIARWTTNFTPPTEPYN